MESNRGRPTFAKHHKCVKVAVVSAVFMWYSSPAEGREGKRSFVLAFQTRETGGNSPQFGDSESRRGPPCAPHLQKVQAAVQNRAVTVTPDFREGARKGRLSICTVGDSSIVPGQRFSSSDVVYAGAAIRHGDDSKSIVDIPTIQKKKMDF